ncbi:hypothetical protein BATDEDRAFT_24920 [Batrachochytrium dendrobatidis JAM81]|uniref:Uncharacterized protein n=1 Tax=Batrachochytrium dendrobatidis (strain JAM81 / FGSC 10211) TaxID=684364 RepID=F4P2I2_BATDJ|nr:uncharacterized protein BATDEDRAFT_24920 [Batrachochytrium dendrobatidis JAM81]EGF80138.1 hypothetical protein BATDEDRAFT_24920 [Batrachochytrium dendrobatidis JAM81]|eukprot:XP_006678961.1 hypothetical protein BATDEDRAFT_24920 [Batrachochytrium dendrobatidis JAM81]
MAARTVYRASALLNRATALRPVSTPLTLRCISSTSTTHGGHAIAKHDHHDHHDDHHGHHEQFNEPGGPLFGHKATEQFSSVFQAINALVYIAWQSKLSIRLTDIFIPMEVARVEAIRRMAERGEKFDYPLPPHYTEK